MRPFLELLVNVIEQTTGVFNLGKIWLIWLLVFANVTFHHIADVGKTLMCIFFGLDDGEHTFVILSDLSLKCGPNRSKKHVALIGKLVDVVSEGQLNLILYSDLLS
jgi:hypothetical protein